MSNIGYYAESLGQLHNITHGVALRCNLVYYSNSYSNTPMRKVEEQMNYAIRHRKNWAGSNTTVRCFKENGITTEVNVLLHGNCIAWLDTATNDLFVSSCGWETTPPNRELMHFSKSFVKVPGIHSKELAVVPSHLKTLFGQIKPFTDGMKV